MTQQRPQLHYAPPPPWHRRRRFRRGILLITLLAFAASAFYWAPPVWRHAQLLYWQRQCMTYTAPDGHVIYERDPEVAAKLLTGQTGYQTPRWEPSSAATFVPVAWRRFHNLYTSRDIAADSTVFLHALNNPTGQRRLVVVELIFTVTMAEPYRGFVPVETLTVRVLDPARLTTRPTEVTYAEYQLWPPASAPPSPVDPQLNWQRLQHIFNDPPDGHFIIRGGPNRIYAGRPDRHDPTRFTIEFERYGHRRIIDGWLRDNDTVTLQIRP